MFEYLQAAYAKGGPWLPYWQFQTYFLYWHSLSTTAQDTNKGFRKVKLYHPINYFSISTV